MESTACSDSEPGARRETDADILVAPTALDMDMMLSTTCQNRKGSLRMQRAGGRLSDRQVAGRKQPVPISDRPKMRKEGLFADLHPVQKRRKGIKNCPVVLGL